MQVKTYSANGTKVWQIENNGAMFNRASHHLKQQFREIKKDLKLNKYFYRLPGDSKYFFVKDTPWAFSIEMTASWHFQIWIKWYIKYDNFKHRFSSAAPTFHSLTDVPKAGRYCQLNIPFSEVFNKMTDEERMKIAFHLNIFS